MAKGAATRFALERALPRVHRFNVQLAVAAALEKGAAHFADEALGHLGAVVADAIARAAAAVAVAVAMTGGAAPTDHAARAAARVAVAGSAARFMPPVAVAAANATDAAVRLVPPPAVAASTPACRAIVYVHARLGFGVGAAHRIPHQVHGAAAGHGRLPIDAKTAAAEAVGRPPADGVSTAATAATTAAATTATAKPPTDRPHAAASVSSAEDHPVGQVCRPDAILHPP